MMMWLFLIGAILSEVGATLSLRVSVGGRNAWYVAVLAGYVASFIFLSLSLAQGLSLGIAYGIWAAAGVALTAIASKYLFREPFTAVMAFGIALIMGGVLLVEVGGSH